MDKTTTIQDLIDKIGRFIDEREWNPYHSPKNLSMSIAIEAAELMEIFQWTESEDSWRISPGTEQYENVRDEIADVIVYALSLSRVLGMDVSSSIIQKLKKNELKYPVGDNPYQKKRK